MMNFKIIFFWLALVFIDPFASCSQNLALNKSYSLSVKPNYPYTAPSSDTKSLTDGIYTTDGRFWTQPTTVGWRLEDVSITIDLKKSQPIGSVLFSTIRSSDAGVFYPKNIFVFFSDDKRDWKYIGDAADLVDNLPGSNQRKKFIINDINQSARFVKFSAIRQGLYLFCDEIEILKGQKVTEKEFPIVLNDSIEEVLDSLQSPENNRRSIQRQSNSLNTLTDGKILKPNLVNQKTSIDLQSFKSEIGQNNATYLKSKFREPYVIEKYNPWTNLDEFRIPLESLKELDFKFLAPVGDVRYGSFLLTNLKLQKEKYDFKISNNSNSNVELFAVPFVSASFYNNIPDPLVKVMDSITIEPGQSLMFIFKLTALKEGKTQGDIKVLSPEKTTQVNYSLDIANLVAKGNIESLNVNVWAYLVSPMVKNHKEEAVIDLKQHHVNTMVIQPTILPSLKDKQFTTFTTYLQNLKGFKNIFLYMDYSLPVRRNGYKDGQFMSDEWKLYFKKWYYNVVDLIGENVGSETNIYLYPYDEVNANSIADYKRFVFWAQKEIPKIKFFATLNNQKAVDSILPIVDIAQLLPSLTQNLPKHHSDIWIYTGNTPSRDLSPYSFYRLMSWDAFVNGYKGIGFWNYADERNGKNLNLISSKNLNLNGSYSVIYNDTSGNIISSRRWEAFRLGIEDYSILQAYSKKFGDAKAKDLAAQVVNNSDNLNLADTIRDNMIKELSAR